MFQRKKLKTYQNHIRVKLFHFGEEHVQKRDLICHCLSIGWQLQVERQRGSILQLRDN